MSKNKTRILIQECQVGDYVGIKEPYVQSRNIRHYGVVTKIDRDYITVDGKVQYSRISGIARGKDRDKHGVLVAVSESEALRVLEERKTGKKIKRATPPENLMRQPPTPSQCLARLRTAAVELCEVLQGVKVSKAVETHFHRLVLAVEDTDSSFPPDNGPSKKLKSFRELNGPVV